MIQNRLTRAILLPVLMLLPVDLPAAPLSISQAFVDQHADRLEQLFQQLDPKHPAIGPIIAQWQAGKATHATAALAAYFANKTYPTDLLEAPQIPINLEEQAKAALDNRFYILDAWQQIPEGPDGHLDWLYRGVQDDKEIAWMLNRHGFLGMLKLAWESSSNCAYRNQLNRLLTDWIQANPYPGGLSFTPAWRPLEVARRILNTWTQLFYGSQALDPETRLLVLSAIPEHADSLHHHASFWGGNHLISEKLALLVLGSAWPEFKSASAWQADAIEVLSEEFLNQTYPDGSYRELSNHYQRVVLVNAQLFIGLLATIDPEHRSRPVTGRIQSMWDFFAQSMRPDGFGPLNNASDLEANTTFIREVWSTYDRPDWLYMATNGHDGIAPPGPPSVLFPWAGQVYIRNNWKRDADWIYFDAGPYGTAHQHVDRMHLSAVLNGQPMLVDNGRFTYKPGPWKTYFQGPESHNILLLNGQASEQYPREVSQPIPICFEDREDCTYTAAVSQFPGQESTSLFSTLRSPVPWTRSILYDKHGFILILDHVVTFAEHQIEAIWNFHPEISQAMAQDALHLAQGPREIRHHMSEGFYSPDYNRMIPSVRSVFTGSIKEPVTLAWILQNPGEPPVQMQVDSKPGNPVFSGALISEEHVIAEFSFRLFPEPNLLEYRPLQPTR